MAGGGRSKALDGAAKAKSSNDYGYTHFLDLILFAGSPTLQDRLVNYVGLQILKIIESAQPGDSITIIGHSMGTAMAHKAIQALYNENVIDENNVRKKLSGNFKFRNVTMVANTSYALSRDRGNYYSGWARPSLTPGQGCCSTWINVNHKYDPIGQFEAANYKSAPKWLDPDVEMLNWFREIETRQFSSKSIHSINHYFRDPTLHIPFFELTFGLSMTESEKRSSIDEFMNSTPEGKFKSLASHLSTLSLKNKKDFKDFVQSIEGFFECIRSYN